MTIGVFVQYDTPFMEVANLTIPVLREYCARHGYDLHESVNPQVERSIIWDRYKILAENLHTCEWAVHIDADVLITNMNIRLEEFCDWPYCVIISTPICEDGRERMNDGVTFFRNTEDTYEVLREIYSTEQADTIQCGQDELERMWREDHFKKVYDNEDFVGIERHKAINAFLYQEYGMPETTIGQWTPGDFVLHAPGRTNQRRVELFNEHLKHIIR